METHTFVLEQILHNVKVLQKKKTTLTLMMHQADYGCYVYDVFESPNLSPLVIVYFHMPTYLSFI